MKDLDYDKLAREAVEELVGEGWYAPSAGQSISVVVRAAMRKAVAEALACPLPAPMSPEELAEAERLPLLDLRNIESAQLIRRLLDHIHALTDDLRRMAQDNGYLEGVQEGEKRGRASLLPLLRELEWAGSDQCERDYCPVCDGYRVAPDEDDMRPGDHVGHAADCELALALAESPR